ncbi:hypothetical protein T4C_826 [Trichinella pseudospiralis]|uniref:Uncharacterized protein n=1 Tax=Trichinella pseudospiralis TaxID=6337 RepID=A0A0V1IU74_TRIPS|nr:hypothetical protein T4C_826 [Trichinella pseudospiralis]
MQQTWTELMEFFLQKMKRKKPKATAEYGSGWREVNWHWGESCVRCYIVVGLCFGLFNKVYTHCLLFYCLHAIRKARDRKERKSPAYTGPSPNSDGRVNNPVEEADEPARGSVSLHELQTNGELKLKFKKEYRSFWLQNQIADLYPGLWAMVKRFLLAFPSSCLVERALV